MEIRIRAAEAGDASIIDRLILYLDELHAQARPDLFCVASEKPRGEDFLQTALRDPQQQVLVAMRNGEVVGYAHVLIRDTPGSRCRLERHYSEIDTISVHPAAQGLGVGRKLIEAAVGWAASRGVGDHQVGVHQFNRKARAVYEKLGFAPSVTMMRRKG